MKPSVNHFREAKKDTTTLSLYKRIFWIFLVCCIQAIYIPTSFRTSGGIEPKLLIDIFPIWPIWVVPYVLCHPLWFFGFTWLILKMENRLFRATVSACFLTFSIGTLTFIFFPTFVKAATLEGNNIFVLLLRFIHENWGRYDAFPSGHVYITTLLALFYNRWYPRKKFLWMSIVIMVSLSTLFTGQHYIIDIVGGLAVAFVGYRFGWWWVGLSPTINRLKKQYSPPFIPD